MISLRNKMLTASLIAGLFLFTSGRSLGTAQTSATPATSPTPAPAPKPAQTVSEKIATSKSLLDINTATLAQLKALPGMGDAYVQRIIAGRPYTAKNQLVTRGILPQDAYEKIKEQIIAHRPK
jgi:DNA uptake protein ComE-like DNA-binding protein